MIKLGEYLELLANGLSNDEIRSCVHDELSGLEQRLDIHDGRITTKLATCTDVFFTFDEMKQLHEFIANHKDTFTFGPNHDYSATPEETLKTWACHFLGPWVKRDKKKPTVLIPRDFNQDLEHRLVWRRTKKVQSKIGNWYHRPFRPGETSGVRGNPDGRQVPCPNDDGPFRAAKVGFAWDYEHNLGRDLCRCRPCGTVFNTGEYETPKYDALAQALRKSDKRDTPESPLEQLTR